MELFNPRSSGDRNFLPRDGRVLYYGTIYDKEQADMLLSRLMEEIDWKADELILFGKPITTKRKVAWYGDRPFPYRYSGASKVALPWTSLLLEIKAQIEALSAETFNSCLLNLYHSGEEGMSWHSDAERELKAGGAIASLSLGAERKFAFRHKRTKERLDFLLPHGSLLLMTGSTQQHWQHALLPSKKIRAPRINLTFRTIVT